MEKYKEIKKKYNSTRTFIQIDKEIHKKVKDYCKINNIKVKDFLEGLIIEKLKS